MKTYVRFFSLFSLALILALTAIGVVPVSPARAAALVVNSLDDVDDTVCDGTHCSLREAIEDANTVVSDDFITFSVSGTINLTSMLPMVVDNLTIDGGTNITISGDTDNNNVGDVPILKVFTNVNVVLQNLTLTRGMDSTNGGGAILNNGTLTIQNCIVSNNTSTASILGGGGIHNESGSATLTVTDSTFSGNSVTYFGGGIHNTGGTVIISNSTFTGNSSTSYHGGGFYNSTGSLSISNSTFSGNQALNGAGGAISNNTGSGTVTITDSTFSSNQARSGGALHVTNGAMTITGSTFSNNAADDGTDGDGGAIYVTGSGSITVTTSTFSGNDTHATGGRGGGIFAFGATTLTNVTLSDNTAPSGEGGGIYNFGVLTVKNTIVANSDVGGDCVLDGAGSVSGTSSNNLIEDASNACGLTNSVSGNIVGSDPILGSLQNNGGTTDTHALLSGSPAINKGTNSGCPATDQTGLTRPQGGTCDIGAVEKEIISLTLTSTGSEDGWVLESTETSTVGGSMNSTATVFRLGDDVADKQYRAILSFDTGQLPNDAVITKAKIKIKFQSVVGTDPFTTHGTLYLDIRTGSFGNAGLELADFQSAASLGSAGSIPNTPVSNWYTRVLSSTALTYISKTVRTQFRLRFQYGDNDDLSDDYLKFYSGDHANVAVRPTLIIDYYLP